MKLPLTEELIDKLVHYIVLKHEWADNYFLNLYGMGSRLWALGWDYRAKQHQAIMERKIHSAILFKRTLTVKDVDAMVKELGNQLNL